MAITKIGTPELFDFSATNTALQLPTGDTASRPSAPSAGEWRFNSELKYVEFWDGGEWRQIDTEAPPNPDDFPSQNFNVNTYFGNGATQAIDAKFNEAANFNGSSSKIRLPDNSFNSLTSYTVSAFVNVSSTSNNQTIFSNWGYNGSTEKGWIVGLLNGTQVRVFNIKNGTVQTFTSTASAISLNTWTNISITNTQSEIKIYINGSLDITHNTNGFDFDASYPMILNIGAYQYSSGIFGYFNGKIDQVRIFNNALSPTKVPDLSNETTTTTATLNYPVGAGCVAAYQLDGDASDVGGTYGGVTTDIGYTGLKFQPDMIWIKTRNQAYDHNLVDSIRGTTKYLRPNRDIAEVTQSDGVTSLNTTNGFTVGSGGDFGGSSNEYVAWAFKGGGAPTATNSEAAGAAPTPDSVLIDGVSSTAALAGATPATNISANTGSGFSIVKYTGPASNSTIAHGLGVTPSMMIQKPTGVGSWNVYIAPGIIDATSNYYYLVLNSTGAKGTTSSAVPTTTTFNAAASGAIIAYCFADIAGYQKIGSYTGNNGTNTISTEITSGDGGFEPAFLLVKNTASGSTNNWIMVDNKRSPVNQRKQVLNANLSNNETTETVNINFLTNGFQLTNGNSAVNDGSGTYIYLAIAADK